MIIFCHQLIPAATFVGNMLGRRKDKDNKGE